MWLSILWLVLGLTGCALPTPMRFDLRCVAAQNQGVLIIDCADRATWETWYEKQKRGNVE